MKFVSKRLIVSGAVAWLIAVAGTSLSRHSSIASFAQKQTPRFSGALPFEGVAFAQEAPPKPEMSDAVFKNIQVLKGIPVDEFMGTMGLFSAALSACCGDCHTGAGGSNPNWAADPPKKVVARRMIRMVNAINKENFNGRQVVTCWTCHRGNEAPATTPPIDAIYSTPNFVPPDILPAAGTSSGTPSADQILDKYIQAIGGASAWANLKSYTAKGTSMLLGEDRADQAEIYAKAPDQLATIVHEREGDLARTYDGRNAWVMLPLTVVKEYPLTESALAGGKLDARMAFPGNIKSFFNNWRASYPSSIDGHDVYVVQGRDNTGLVATFYFDKQTALLTRLVRYANSAMGRVPTQFDYSDYREVAGVKMPFKFTYGWVSGRENYVISDVQPNASVDTAKFAKPVPRSR
ncbi:MAG TPA: photosynthetic reaction center cytochrome c subunit family protein [Bryobacteraceae bacterium]|nr:photosynthetic reaction center cytochrome c subunit family protein [Bryobacteraceae bacterium]